MSELSCSFCRTSAQASWALVAGATTAICDSCTYRVREGVREVVAAVGSADGPSDGACSFCRAVEVQLVVPPGVRREQTSARICHACVRRAAHSIPMITDPWYNPYRHHCGRVWPQVSDGLSAADVRPYVDDAALRRVLAETRGVHDAPDRVRKAFARALHDTLKRASGFMTWDEARRLGNRWLREVTGPCPSRGG